MYSGRVFETLLCSCYIFSADKLQVTALKGIMGEEIELVVRVQAFPKASKWLKTLENVMKNTTAMILQACVQTRMEEGISIVDYTTQPIHSKQILLYIYIVYFAHLVHCKARKKKFFRFSGQNLMQQVVLKKVFVFSQLLLYCNSSFGKFPIFFRVLT